MTHILNFNGPGARELALVGGKGANLAALTSGGFQVPPGFVVTTAAYGAFLEQNGLRDKIAAMVGAIDFRNFDQLEAATAEIRELVQAGTVPPELAASIADAYADLGDELLVAVRSSGTAEDLEDASFAGQHDTYLHIKGRADVIDAVKRCWASLWTARATAYRGNQGFDQLEAQIAIVVQRMVNSEVSGVMFTGNPMTTATDEAMINASYGLGEATVSGIVTPDEFTVGLDALEIRERKLGTKKVRIVLDEQFGSGTVEEQVSVDLQDGPSLSDAQVSELAGLGRRVMEFYGGMPQDIEWGLFDGQFLLLQSRPITGVEFSWDNDVDDWQIGRDETGTLWTRSWADEVWTGAVSPLMYSCRGEGYYKAYEFKNKLHALDDATNTRHFKFYKSGAYYNTRSERVFVESLIPPALRAGALAHVGGPDEQAAVLKAPFQWSTWLKAAVRTQVLEPNHRLYSWLGVEWDYIRNRREQAKGRSREEIRALSDRALIDYAKESVDYENKYVEDAWVGFFYWIQQVGLAYGYFVTTWYQGDNPYIMGDLLTGSEQRTAAIVEAMELWELSLQIRRSETLLGLFRANRDGEFHAALQTCEEGRAFAERYQTFLGNFGHRGHEDRDLSFPRRIEDPAIDYRAFELLLQAGDDTEPEEREHAANARRRAAFDDVIQDLRRQPMGFAKAEAFKVMTAYMQQVLVIRDDQRDWADLASMRIRTVYQEIATRLLDRGLIETERDIFFLSKEELADLFRTGRSTPLIKAKIAARMRNFDRVRDKDVTLPEYIRDYQGVQVGPELDTEGGLKGIGTSRGQITGRAKVLHSLKDIGRVQQGDILIVNSTDPGWTPVFLLIGGLVLETGGVLAHGSCLSREYGIPAVQVTGATQRIPDGAMILVNGDIGEVVVLEEEGLTESQA